jgi:hypothetical protein
MFFISDLKIPKARLVTVKGSKKSMCLAAASGVAVAAAKLLLARWESWYMY